MDTDKRKKILKDLGISENVTVDVDLLNGLAYVRCQRPQPVDYTECDVLGFDEGVNVDFSGKDIVGIEDLSKGILDLTAKWLGAAAKAAKARPKAKRGPAAKAAKTKARPKAKRGPRRPH